MTWRTWNIVAWWGMVVVCVGAAVMPPRTKADDLDALNRQMLELFQNGEYAAATAVAERAVAAAKVKHGESRPEYAREIGKLAHTLLVVNRFSDAEPLFQRALEICAAALPPDHAALADALDGMGSLYMWQGKWEEAEPLLKQALAIREKTIAADEPAFLELVDRLAAQYLSQGRIEESERSLRRAIDLIESKLGLDHPLVAALLTQLSRLYLVRTPDASKSNANTEETGLAALQRQSTQLLEEFSKPGANIEALLARSNELSEQITRITEDILKPHSEVEAVKARSAAILARAIETGQLDRSTKLAIGSLMEALSDLASSYKFSNRFTEAEQVYGLIRDIRIPAVNANYASGAASIGLISFVVDISIPIQGVNTNYAAGGGNNWFAGMNGLLDIYEQQQRFAEFESSALAMIDASEKKLQTDAFAEVARARLLSVIKRLAMHYDAQKNYAKAEVYLEREAAILEAGPDPLRAADALARVLKRDILPGLAGLYEKQGRLADAEAALARAASIREKIQGPAHPDVIELRQRMAGLRERQAGSPVQTASTHLPPVDRPILSSTAECSDMVALLDQWDARQAEARKYCSELEWMALRAAALVQQQLGQDNTSLYGSLTVLAQLAFQKGQWADAVALLLRATQIAANARRRTGHQIEPLAFWLDASGRSVSPHLMLVKAAYRLAAMDQGRLPELTETTFAAVQQARPLAAAAALGQMSARQAKGTTALARLVRERQDLGGEWEKLDQQFAEALKRSDQGRNQQADRQRRERMEAIDARLAEIDKALAKNFPDYAAFANPEPLTIAEVQAQLRPDEAIVLLAYTPELGSLFQTDLPAETFIWVVSKTKSRWAKVELGGKALTQEIGALRCGLDRSNWAAGSTTRERCKKLLNVEITVDGLLPFDLSRAHSLYGALFGQMEDLIAGKHLLVVPTGPFTNLPFAVLVTNKPAAVIPTGLADYRGVKWLGRQQPISVLPSAASLKALRERTRPSTAAKPFLGFGNPLLDGNPSFEEHRERAILAQRKQICPGPGPAIERLRSTVAGWPVIDGLFRGKLGDAAALRRQLPLPETADELCAVAGKLGAQGDDIRLGLRMTEAAIKDMNAKGDLRNYRVLHFATHGLVAGETELFAKGEAEPALMFTPPETASDDDDGLLTASEVTQLKLDADWIVMSACNTAAGGTREAEALSGLARAFFYAGARSLLVSHWAVDSEAAVAITTGAFDAMRASPAVGRAEALRRSLAALIDKGGANAHPAIWAPFALVGEGGAVGSAARAQTSPVIVPVATKKPSVKAKTPSRRTPPPTTSDATLDWRDELWRR